MISFTFRLAASACLFAAANFGVTSAQGDERVGTVISSHDPIPNNYDSWSLFVVCNPGWFLDNNSAQLASLFQQFSAFGAAIGPRNVAIWFSTTAPHSGKVEVAGSQYDAARASEYCGYYRVLPSQSPFVIVTTRYPDMKQPPAHYYRMSLDGADTTTTIKLLQAVADQIVVTGLMQKELDSDQYWSTWEQIARQVTNGGGRLFDRLAITIDTSFLKVELGPGSSLH
jgi:hypothetical protein